MIPRENVDVVVIGGSLAGAACAIRLASEGIESIAFDRRRSGTPRVCGAFLSPGAVGALEALGLLDEVRSAGAVPIEAARISVGRAIMETPFEEPALGFSRRRLDSIMASRARVRSGCTVEQVEERGSGYRVRVREDLGEGREVFCRAVVDAAGRSSRFSRRKPAGDYGVQFESPAPRDPVLEFGFFSWGYGGSVSVEGSRSNSCYLVRGEHVGQYVRRRECLVTGPISYEPLPSPYLTVGDAAGMIDPFCGEGMRHAIESGVLAARTLGEGLARGRSYREMCGRYRVERDRQWASKRRLGARLRWMLGHERALRASLTLGRRFPRLTRACLRELWR